MTLTRVKRERRQLGEDGTERRAKKRKEQQLLAEVVVVRCHAEWAFLA
jgi:hypothetical protein